MTGGTPLKYLKIAFFAKLFLKNCKNKTQLVRRTYEIKIEETPKSKKKELSYHLMCNLIKKYYCYNADRPGDKKQTKRKPKQVKRPGEGSSLCSFVISFLLLAQTVVGPI